MKAAISKRLDAFLASKFPVESVPQIGVCVMRRFFVRRSKEKGNVYVHHFIAAQNEERAHDHPWNFISFMLAGGYTEIVYDHGKEVSRTRYSAPRVLYRDRNCIHKLVEIEADTWTVVFTSRWLGRWGYWTEQGRWLLHTLEHAAREALQTELPPEPATLEAQLAEARALRRLPSLMRAQPAGRP